MTSSDVSASWLDEVQAFARVYFDRKAAQVQLYAHLNPIVARLLELGEDERAGLRGELTDYVRLHAFLAQVLTFADADLEKLYQFCRYLRRLLPVDKAGLPREVQQNIDMESYRLQRTASCRIQTERGCGEARAPAAQAPREGLRGAPGAPLPDHRRTE